jgi:zinc transporter 9
MIVASFLCGMLPLLIILKKDSMNSITLFGAGLLLGTALGVIIPEGTLMILESSAADVQVEKVVAICLISGFCGMLIIEQISLFFMNKTHKIVGIPTISCTESTSSLKNNYSTMMGILIHSLADGVAFASVSISDQKTLETIVFLAIIIHKCPAAFGISCFLLGNGESRKNVKRFQLLFSLSAVSLYYVMISL